MKDQTGLLSLEHEIPIPNCRFAPVPLLSIAFPCGLPHEAWSARTRSRVEADTLMADMAAQHSMAKHAAGLLFALEHTGRSIALHLESWKRLMSMEGVHCTFYHTCMFHPGRRRKYQMIIHNHNGLHSALHKLCLDKHGNCCRTGSKHLTFAPR